MNPTIKRLLAYCASYPRWLVQAGICLLLATGALVAGGVGVVALTSRFVRFGVVCSVVVSFTRFVVIVPSPSLLTPVRASFSFPRRSRASKTCVCGRGMRVRKPRSRCRSSMRRLLATIRRLKRMSL